MKKCILMDSEYCSMGRWISVIVGNKLNMKLYEGKDLVKLVNEDWLTEELLKEYDNRIGLMTVEEVKKDKDTMRIQKALSKALIKAYELGPCIIHERAAGEILKDKSDCLRVLLYNTSMKNRIIRAKKDKTYQLENKDDNEIVEFTHREDNKRKVYRDAYLKNSWGHKDNYDICMDSDKLSKEKCAEILIEAMKDISLDLDECNQIIKQSF